MTDTEHYCAAMEERDYYQGQANVLVGTKSRRAALLRECSALLKLQADPSPSVKMVLRDIEEELTEF